MTEELEDVIKKLVREVKGEAAQADPDAPSEQWVREGREISEGPEAGPQESDDELSEDLDLREVLAAQVTGLFRPPG